MEILSELQYVFLQFEIDTRSLTQESMQSSCILGNTHMNEVQRTQENLIWRPHGHTSYISEPTAFTAES
jgi:hypothetical protein